jgi:membrane protein DedA with SNARE-associated domain
VEELIPKITTLITQYGPWAGPIVGFLAFGESLAVIGVLIPATAVLFAVGGLMGAGVLEPLPMLFWAIGGAILGDWLSYAVGRKIGPRAYRSWPLNRHRPGVARARVFFRKYGFSTVFLGRFLGPLRATVPVVAGVMEMNRRRFQVANILSAAIWVPAIFAPGFFAAESLGPNPAINEIHILVFAGAIVLFTSCAAWIGSRVLLGDRQQREKSRRTRQTAAAVRTAIKP